jgi:hypothetical protein
MEQLPSVTSTSAVVIAQLCRSSEFQVRSKLCQSTVNRYAAAIKAGQQLPPLSVALVDGVPCLVDGYHRAAALELLGSVSAEAVVTTTTKLDAQWMAAKANMQHGLPLKSKELRQAFRVYIRTGQHRKGRGKLKSYREIGQEIGRSHVTIRNWMAQDFKKLFREYGQELSNGMGEEAMPEKEQPPADAKPALERLAQVRQDFQATSCPNAREAIRQALHELKEELLQDWKEPESDF